MGIYSPSPNNTINNAVINIVHLKKYSKLILFILFVISPILVTGLLFNFTDTSNEQPESQSIRTVKITRINNEKLPESRVISYSVNSIPDSEKQSNPASNSRDLPHQDETSLQGNLEATGLIAKPNPLSLQPTPQAINVECATTLTDVLVVDHGQSKGYIINNGFTYTAINEESFRTITVNQLLKYRM